MSINPLFSTTPLSTEGMEKYVAISEAFTKLVSELEELLPGNSREVSMDHNAKAGGGVRCR